MPGLTDADIARYDAGAPGVLSDADIAAHDSGGATGAAPSLGHVGDFISGIGAGGIGTVLGAYELLRKIPGADKVLPPVSDQVRSYAEPPDTVAAKVGRFLEQGAELAAPAGAAAELTKGAGLAARMAAQALAAGGTRAVQTGGDIPQALDAAAGGAALPLIPPAAGAAMALLKKSRGLSDLAPDLVGMVNPRAAHALRVAQKVGRALSAPAPAEDQELLDGLAQGFGGKDFEALSAGDQATVRSLADRINAGEAPQRTAAPAAAPQPTTPTPTPTPTTPTPAAATPKPQPVRPPLAQPAPAAPAPSGPQFVNGQALAGADKWKPATETVRPVPGSSMGDMGQYRSDYNPAALTDEEIAALNKQKPAAAPDVSNLPESWQPQTEAAAPQPRDYAGAARGKKADALANFLYNANGEIEAGQGISYKDASNMTPEQWTAAAKGARVNDPSPSTIQAALLKLKSLYDENGTTAAAEAIPNAAATTTQQLDTGATGPLDSGAARSGSQAYGAGAPGAGSLPGQQTEILIPGEDRALSARYEVRELADVQPSHNGTTFSPNPRYQLHNERNYSNPENQQRIVLNSGEQQFNPRYHITDNPDATNGPVVIDEAGNALGGNGRAMILQRVYDRGAAGATAYRNLLLQKAQQFGIDPAQVQALKQPVLVRVVPDSELQSLPGGANYVIRKTNVSGTAQLSAAERAAADAGQLGDDSLQHIASAIDQAGPDATLNDALTGKSGTAIVNRLISDGFFSEQERPALMDGKTGALTQLARDRINKAMVGQFFRDSDQIARTPAAIKGKLERLAAPLAKVRDDPQWDITPAIREGVDLLEYAQAHGIKNLGDVVSQQGLFGGAPEWSPQAVQMAELLRDSKPNDLVRAVRGYVNDRAPTMFGQSTPQQSFGEHFGGEPSSATAVPDISPTEFPMTPEERAIEARFNQQIAADPEGMKAEYRRRFGTMLSTDDAKELSPDYLRDRAAASIPVHEGASWLVKQIYREELAKQAPPGADNTVLFTAGGPGSGKTTAIAGLPAKSSAQMVYDGTLASAASATKRIDQALAAGKQAHVVYVYRDPEGAFEGVLGRAVSQEQKFGSGRTYPIDRFVEQHVDVRNSMQQLAEKYKGNPNFHMTVIDNSSGPGMQQLVNLEDLPAAPDAHTLRAIVKERANEAYQNGDISRKIYDATISRGAAKEAGR